MSESTPPNPTPAAAEDADAARAQRMHERTGEIELLISGALVFGLFQLPGLIGEVVAQLTPRLAEGQFIVVFMVSFYMRLVLMTLLVAFLLHLVARAYWVGLIGLDSVFPEGIYWDRIKYGPVAKDVYQKRVRRVPAMARRADDFGSSIFSFAFWISVIFIWSIVFGGLVGGIWYLFKVLFAPDLPADSFFLIVIVLASLPTVAIGLDKALAGRIDEHGFVAGAIRRVVAGAYWVTAGPVFMPIQFTLFSRVPKKWIWPLFVGVFSALLLGFLGSTLWQSGTYRVSSNEIFPERPGPRTLLDDHFADTRALDSTRPYVQARVIDEPYVVVTVPLVALRLRDRFAGVCPDFDPKGGMGFVVLPDRDEPADAEYEKALLDCLGQVWSLRLDGTPIPAEWDLEWEAGFGPTSVVAYLPTDPMAPGPHVLEVIEAPRPSDPETDEGETAGEDDDAERRPVIDYIRFRR